MISHHCVSCTVIPGFVLCVPRALLQEILVLGCFSGDGDAVLEVWAVVNFSTITYVPHPCQPLPWQLTDPGAAVTTGDGVT
jgi:hypothetical protein